MSDGVSKKLGDMLSEAASAGYEAVEMNLSPLLNPGGLYEVKSLLERNFLKLSSLYSGGVFHESAAAETTVAEILEGARLAAQLGVSSITVNPSPKGGREKTDDELKIQAEYLNKLGSGLQSHNMSLFVHNHTPEIVNNAREFRSYCDQTDPKFVNVCMDVHWVYRGGVDPFQLTQEYGSRIGALHIRNSVDGVWTEELGDGDIDYRAYRGVLESINYKGWLTVELAYEEKTKITRSVVENARLSRGYIRQVFGV